MKKTSEFLAIVFLLVLFGSCTKETQEMEFEDPALAAKVFQDPGQVDAMPEFEGGHQAFFQYIAQNVKYPAEARKNGTEGKVYVSFVVDKDGQVTMAQLVAGKDLEGEEIVVVGYNNSESESSSTPENFQLLVDEALRVVSESPAWKPGRVDGHPVKVQMTIPIIFKLG